MWYHTQMDFRLVLYIVIREDMAVVQLRLGKSKTYYIHLMLQK
jgi:hypothetical protein